jgi:TolB-like protein
LRRLAAILAVDVVGYSRLMEMDETGTLAALKERRTTLVQPLVSKYDGRMVKIMGDGALIEFGSAVNAVRCAIEVQEQMAAANAGLAADRRIVMRMGVNLGDIVVEGGDIYGDGVNLAARLEGLAEPGDILISGSVHEQVKRKLECRFENLGFRSVRNMDEPVQVYRVHVKAAAAPQQPALQLPAKPSIAVLPFTNMSNDPEQETFVDGLTEDLITDLSKNPGLFVIARNSTFAYKGRPLDARTIARDLGVRYLLEGSARRSGGRVRINAQLIDAVGGGGHLWAERFDRGIEDIFAVQDEVTAKIVEALVGRLTAAPPRNRPANLEAYELCVRGRGLVSQSAPEAREARVLLQRAIALDPGYAEAHSWLAISLWFGWVLWGEEAEPNRSTALATAERAVALDPNDAGCRWVYGCVLAYERRWAESDAEFSAALQLDPNHADARAWLADISIFKGQADAAVDHIQRALRLNPHPPGWYFWMRGMAHYAAGRYEDAIEALRNPGTYRTASRRILAASLARLGRIEEARREAELFMISNPHFTVSQWSASQPFSDEAMRQHFIDGYRMAGLPE